MSDSVRHLSYEEAARELGVSVRTVYRRVRSGQLASVERDGRSLVVLEQQSRPTPIRPPIHAMTSTDTVSDSVMTNGNLVSQLRLRLAEMEAERDRWRGQAEKLTDTVSELSANVSQLTQTVQGLEVMRAQSEGRMIAAETPPGRPNATPEASTPPRRRRGLRELYRAWRGR